MLTVTVQETEWICVPMIASYLQFSALNTLSDSGNEGNFLHLRCH